LKYLKASNSTWGLLNLIRIIELYIDVIVVQFDENLYSSLDNPLITEPNNPQ